MLPLGAAKLLWTYNSRLCVVCLEDPQTEVRLYEDGQLIALWPCRDMAEVFRVSKDWLAHPPLWPPF